MNKLGLAGVSYLAVVIYSLAQEPPASITSPDSRPLIQVEQLVGDQVVGFTEKCLLIYSDGRYHRESRQQEERGGHPRGEWQSAQVFEGKIEDLQSLRDLVETSEFRGIARTVGEPKTLSSHLAFTPLGVVPHADVSIFEASVAHEGHPQVFEVIGGPGIHQPSSLILFRKRIADVEKCKDQKLDSNKANSCSVSQSSAKAPSWVPSTSLMPRVFYSPTPATGLSGEIQAVVVDVTVNSDGTVGQASIRRSANPIVNDRALEIVKKWRFFPARINGIAVASAVSVQIQLSSD